MVDSARRRKESTERDITQASVSINNLKSQNRLSIKKLKRGNSIADSEDPYTDAGAPKKLKISSSGIFARKSTQGDSEAPRTGPIKAGKLSIKKKDVMLNIDN